MNTGIIGASAEKIVRSDFATAKITTQGFCTSF